jgi:diguanylate cyclase (GGDEF)-like protein
VRVIDSSTPGPGQPARRTTAQLLARSGLWRHLWPYPVAAALVAAEVIASVVPQPAPASVLVIRGVLWLGIALVLALVTYNLRQGLSRTERERNETLRRATTLGLAAQHLTVIRDPEAVVSAACRLSAELVAPPGTRRRSDYYRLQEENVSVPASYDETGSRRFPDRFPLAHDSGLEQAVRTRQVVVVTAPRPIDGNVDFTHTAYMPIHFQGELDGVLAVTFEGRSASPVTAEECKAVTHMVELALDNARAHALLREQATTDPLTGLANRRGFERRVANRPGRGPFVILAIDLDDLKQVNDSMGHFVGDQLLIGTAQAVKSVLRRGDVLARIGGDEFVIYSFLSTLEDGRHIATRILDSLSAIEIAGFQPGVSIGVAAGGPTDSVTMVHEAADGAMYESKRKGGRQYTLVDASAGLQEAVAQNS